MRAFGMSTMQYCGTSFARIALASLFGTLTTFGLNGAVLAAGTCIEARISTPARAIGTTALIASIIASVGT